MVAVLAVIRRPRKRGSGIDSDHAKLIVDDFGLTTDEIVMESDQAARNDSAILVFQSVWLDRALDVDLAIITAGTSIARRR